MTQTERKPMVGTQGQKQIGFWIHLTVFLLTNAGLITLNFVRSPDKLWFHWVLMGWGAGLLLNGYRAFGGTVRKTAERTPEEETRRHRQ